MFGFQRGLRRRRGEHSKPALQGIVAGMARPFAGLCLLLLVTPATAKTAVPGVTTSAKNQMFDVVSAVHIAAVYGTVTSVFRSAAHNRAVGGVRNSYHLRGQAIDLVRRAGVSHQAVEVALISAGYHIIESLDEGDHSHFAFTDRRLSLGRGATSHRSLMPRARAQTVENGDSAKRLPPTLAADEHGSLLVMGAPLIGDEPKVSSETP